MPGSPAPQTPIVPDLLAARLTAGLAVVFALLTVVSHRPDVLLAAAATGLALIACLMLLHRHSQAAGAATAD